MLSTSPRQSQSFPPRLHPHNFKCWLPTSLHTGHPSLHHHFNFQYLLATHHTLILLTKTPPQFKLHILHQLLIPDHRLVLPLSHNPNLSPLHESYRAKLILSYLLTNHLINLPAPPDPFIHTPHPPLSLQPKISLVCSMSFLGNKLLLHSTCHSSQHSLIVPFTPQSNAHLGSFLLP